MKAPLKIGVLAALCLPTALLQATETITFNDLDPGEVVGTVSLPGVGTVTIKGIRPGKGDPPATNFAITFPSNAPPGLDFDLGSPNQTCGGPGVSNDVPGNPDSGEVGGAHPNCPPPNGPLDPMDPNIPLNNVLIVADNLIDADMNGLVDVPNDHAGDNNLIFKFIDKAVRFTSIALLDIQAPLSESATVFLYEDLDCTNLIAEIELDKTGDNGLIIFKFDPFAPARCMIVDVNGSGAIDNIVVNSCGDGVVDPGEQCDGTAGGCEDCRDDCTCPDCGDGIVDAGEQCDGTAGGCEDCRDDCTCPDCGDGIVDAGEQCDGTAGGCEDCRGDCTCPDCGDGIVDVGEQCDGTAGGCEDCRGDCTCPDCGDGVVDAGEQCDGMAGGCEDCRGDCTCPDCGDGVVDAGEQCDGMAGGCEDCRGDCTCPDCGDGVVDAGEQCDGMAGGCEDCRGDCTCPDCGDGVVDAGEQCDGMAGGCEECRDDCTCPDCGDGVVDAGEECDGMAGGCEDCRGDCTCPACGDGTVDSGEECDDGNDVDDDDCRNNCTEPDVLECRVTGGANGHDAGRERGDSYHGSGQAGAPGPDFGEWTHHQKNGPDGKFIFHAGTASSPDETFIEVVTCSDPGFCHPARHAPAKQIDFQGVGQFKNMQNPSPALSGVVVKESLHWFEVHIEDLGEPGGPQGGSDGDCPPEGSAGSLADCNCPDFYRIDIYAGFEAGETPNKTDVIYSVFNYIDSGNYQIHPALRSR